MSTCAKVCKILRENVGIQFPSLRQFVDEVDSPTLTTALRTPTNASAHKRTSGLSGALPSALNVLSGRSSPNHRTSGFSTEFVIRGLTRPENPRSGRFSIF